MTATEIIGRWLLENSYDGLCNPELECGCDVDDLFPCGHPNFECIAAVRVQCVKCDETFYTPNEYAASLCPRCSTDD